MPVYSKPLLTFSLSFYVHRIHLNVLFISPDLGSDYLLELQPTSFQLLSHRRFPHH